MTRKEIMQQLEYQSDRIDTQALSRWLRALRTADARVATHTDRRAQRTSVRLAKHATSWADGVFQAGAL